MIEKARDEKQAMCRKIKQAVEEFIDHNPDLMVIDVDVNILNLVNIRNERRQAVEVTASITLK